MVAYGFSVLGLNRIYATVTRYGDVTVLGDFWGALQCNEQQTKDPLLN